MSPAATVIHDQTSRLPQKQLLVVFFALNLALFLSFLDATSVTTAIPHIAEDLDAASSIIWVGTSFLIANTGFQIITSRLSDIIGRKYVLLGALGLFGIGDLLCGFAQTKEWLYICRAISGIGGGGINSLSMIIVSDVVTLQKRGRYQGLLGISIALGSGVGPVIGGILSTKASWRWVFWITPPMTAATMIAIFFLLPLKKVPGSFGEKIKQIDWIGSVLSLGGIVIVLIPISGGGSTYDWKSPIVIAMLCVGGCLLVGFLFVEAWYAKLPILPLRMFKNRTIALLHLQTWFVGMVMYGNLYLAPIYLQNIGGFPALIAGLIMLPLVVTQVFSTTICGFVVERTGHCRPSMMVGFVLWFAGQAAQIVFGRETGIGVVVGVLLIQGIGIGCTLQSLVLAQASGPSADRAVITGARNFFRTSGGALGLAISNSVLNNKFISGLPLSLDPAIKADLQLNGFSTPAGVDAETVDAIMDSYAVAVRDVFIYFAPVIGACLVITFFLKDVSLLSEIEQESAETSSTEIVELPSTASLDEKDEKRKSETK